MNHRPGSRKAQVHAEFNNGGLEKALQLGLELGLKAGTIKSWAGSWAKQSAGGPPKPTNTAGPTKRKRVTFKDSPGSRTGVVVQAGPEQSVVKWDNGIEQVCVNRWLQEVE